MDIHNVVRRFLLMDLLRRKCIHERTAECVLYPGQLMLLEAVIANPDITQQALSVCLGVTPASVAQSVKRLCSAGLIQKRADPKNLRQNRLRSTAEGQLAADLYRKNFDEVDRETFAGFTDDELLEIAAYLDRMIANIAGPGMDPNDFLNERTQKHD